MIRFLARHKTTILWISLLFYVIRQTSLSGRGNGQQRPVPAYSQGIRNAHEQELYFHGVPADDNDDEMSSAEHGPRRARELGAPRAVQRPEEHKTVADVVPHKNHDVGGPKPKRILYWTKYFRSAQFQFGFGQWPFVHHKCPVDACTATNDKSTLADADVVVFHGPLIRKLPEVRYPGQIYVFVQKEPWLEKSNKTLPAFNDVMNVTMTYRLDSDVVLPYGLLFRNESDRARRHPVDPALKRRSVAWPVSHCETESQRELYARELGRHIDVDVYGECGRLKCPKEKNPECWEMFGRDYRFVIAFENDVCRDYVTEKAYRPLQHDTIPIVYGGANYRRLLPKGSFIDVREYADPKELAKHLRYLARNRTAYNEYFRWKEGGFQVETFKEELMANAFCELCAIVHNRHYKYRRYRDLRGWWVDGVCDRHAMAKLKASWSKG